MDEARPHPEGSLYARVEYHTDICDACVAGEEEEDVIAYVSTSEIEAEKDGRSFQEVKIETKILLLCGEERAIIDTGAYSVWVSRKIFAAAQGYVLCLGGLQEKGVDRTPIELVGEGRLYLELWGNTFVGIPGRIMNHVQSGIFLGRMFLLENKVVLDLRDGHGSLVSAGITHEGCILARNVGDNLAEQVAFVSEDVTATIEGMDLSEFGDGRKDQDALRNVLSEYTDVFSPTTETVPGVEYVIQQKPDADLSQLNMKSFRKSPKELGTEREAMERLLERGIVRPSASCYGTNNGFVEKRRHPDGTSAGIRETADMRAVNSVSVGDAFPTEDVKAIVSWMSSKKWFSVMDLRDGYWNIALSKESRKFTAIKTAIGWWSM
jgi:hypothetical protein